MLTRVSVVGTSGGSGGRADERGARRKSPHREIRLVAAAEASHSGAKGINEGGVGAPEGIADSAGRSVNEGGGTGVRSNRPIVRVLSEYPGGTKAGPAGACALVAGFGFDYPDEFGAGGAVASRGKIAPRGEAREVDLVLGGKLPVGDTFPAAAGIVRGGPVVPDPAELGARGEGPNAGEPGPIGRPVDEPLLATVLKDVAQAGDGGSLVGHDNGPVPARPEAVTPIVDAADLPGDVAIDESEKGGKLSGVVDRNEAVPVVREYDEGVDANCEQILRPANDAEDDLIDLGRRP